MFWILKIVCSYKATKLQETTTLIQTKMDNMLFGCFKFMGGSIDTLIVYLNFMGDMWILSDYLNGMLYKECDGKNQIFIVWC